MVKKKTKKIKKKIKQKDSEGEDKDKDNQNNKGLLNESKDIDYQKFLKTIDKELNKNSSSSPKEIIKQNGIVKNQDSIYKKMQNIYLKNNLNMNIFSMITQIINTSTTLPNELKNYYPLNNILLDITKELMFTDLELVYFSLYLDNFGWTNEYYDVKDNLIITGLSVKKYLNKDIDIIEDHLDKTYINIEEKFKNWLNSQSDKNKNLSFSPIMVNERNNLLKKPYNCYCRNNYIDYNHAVDKILQFSQSYNEINKHSKKINIKSKNNTETENFDLVNGMANNGEEIFTDIPSNVAKNNNIIMNDKIDFSLYNNSQNNNNINNNLLEKKGITFDYLFSKDNDKNNSQLKIENIYPEDNGINLSRELSFINNHSDLQLNRSLEPSFMKPK